MNLTYEATESGYTIFNDGKAWIVQDSFIPYPGDTIEESAQNHIDRILADNENPASEPIDDIQLLKEENMELKLAMAELAESQELEKLNTQLALAELAEMMTGGDE